MFNIMELSLMSEIYTKPVIYSYFEFKINKIEILINMWFISIH